MAEYISKDSAISIFNAKAEMAVCTPAQPYFAKAAKMIELLPAADVAPVVHGEWVSNELGGYKWGYNCSVCGWLDGYPFNERHKYCPNCGARMGKEGRP